MLAFDNGALRDARIVIDGRATASSARTFRRRCAAKSGPRSRKFASHSATDVLIQLADMCAGAIARSYKEDRKDAGRWKAMLKPRIADVWDFK